MTMADTRAGDGRRILKTTELASLEARIAALTREAAEITPRLSDSDLEIWIQYHGRLFDTAVIEANRRKDHQK